MALRRRAEFLFVTLLAAPLAASAQSGSIYCCNDANGRPVCGDVLPSICFGRAYREISPQGTVRRHVAAPLTREEVARRDAEEKLRQDEEALRMKQRRLDQALLETYKGLEDIDARQARAVAAVERHLDELRVREAELRKQRQQYEDEAAAYRGRELPRALASSLQTVDSELASLRGVAEARTREIEAIRARFAADRRRYVELIAAGEGRR